MIGPYLPSKVGPVPSRLGPNVLLRREKLNRASSTSAPASAPALASAAAACEEAAAITAAAGAGAAAGEAAAAAAAAVAASRVLPDASACQCALVMVVNFWIHSASILAHST